MNVLIVTGIWPPDVGGPASHAPEVAEFLRGRGHAVEVVTTADSAPSPRPYPVRAASRGLAVPLRYGQVLRLVRAGAARADVVYVASMLTRAAAATLLTRTPFVVKLPSDPAFERARRRGLFDGDLDGFQRAPGAVLNAMRTTRSLAVHRAAHVVCPSEYLRGLTISWGVDPSRVTVLPNPAPDVPGPGDQERFDGPTLVFAGRLNAQKSLGVALDALALVDGAELVVAGEGPERESLERQAIELGLNGRVRFLGAQPRERVLDLFRAADAAVLSSAWENLPHTVVEALAVGTPVIATAVGGVPEVVEDGRNGLLVPPGDPQALAGALRRFLADAGLRQRLRAEAAPSVERFAPEAIFGRLEEILIQAAGR